MTPTAKTLTLLGIVCFALAAVGAGMFNFIAIGLAFVFAAQLM